MKVFVRCLPGPSDFELDLDGEMTLADVRVLLECETDIDSERLLMHHRDQPLDDLQRTLDACGVIDGNTLYVSTAEVPFSAAALVPADVVAVRNRQEMQQIQADPYTLGVLRQQNPTMADAVMAGDVVAYSTIRAEQEEHRRAAQQEQIRRAAALEANPFDVDAQRFIEDQIRKENVESLRQEAIEHMPESFGTVVMLYIDVVVNGHPIKAFVDSGAQSTIMSQACAQRCGIDRLIDTRFSGTAVGVGTQRILGRVHMYRLEIADANVPTSFTILERQPMDMLLGLDMLRRHQCVIDLQNNRLVIGTTGTSTPFLAEKDLPACARLGAQSGEAAGEAEAEAASAGPPSAGGATVQFPDADIAQLCGLGNFSRAQVIEALTVCDGSTDRAAAYLFQNAAS